MFQRIIWLEIIQVPNSGCSDDESPVKSEELRERAHLVTLSSWTLAELNQEMHLILIQSD